MSYLYYARFSKNQAHVSWKSLSSSFGLFLIFGITVLRVLYQIMDALLNKQKRFTFEDETQQTPLHLAAQYGMFAHVEALARRVASGLNERDDQGRTPLHNAVVQGHR